MNYAFCLPFVLASLLGTNPAHAAPATTLYTAGGWKLAVTLEPDQETVLVGAPLWLSYRVYNLTDENLQVVVGGDYRNALGRPNSFKVITHDAAGRDVPQPKVEFDMGGLMGPQPLPAGSHYTFRLFLADWATIDKPGTFTMTARKSLRILRSNGDFMREGTNVTAEASAVFAVSPADHEKMGKVIAELGSRILGQGDREVPEARKSLASIADARVVPHLLNCLARPDYEAKFFALRTLGQFDTAEALNALKSGLELTGRDLPGSATTDKLAEQLAVNLRIAAIQALANHPNPAARQFLLSRRHEPFNELRLTVVHMLGRSKSAESLAILKEMTADTNATVRGEAERYLKLLESPSVR